MRRRVLLIVVALSLTSRWAFAQADSEKVYKVSGVGGFPISDRLTSMWLAGPDRQPLIMVYFNGSDGWHKTEWKTSSKFEKGMPGWAEFISSKAKQRIWLDPETGAAEVQSEKVSTRNANAYLVLHMAEDASPQKIVPLGTFDLPRSADQAASVLLLRAKPELAQKVEKIIGENGG